MPQTITVLSMIQMGFPHLLSKICSASNPEDAQPHSMLLYVKFSWHRAVFDMAHAVSTPMLLLIYQDMKHIIHSVYFLDEMFKVLFSCHSDQGQFLAIQLLR